MWLNSNLFASNMMNQSKSDNYSAESNLATTNFTHEALLNCQTSSKSSNMSSSIATRKPYTSKTPLHRQKPRHVPSFCSLSDSSINNFEKGLFNQMSSDSEKEIISSHYEPGTIGLRRYAVTHQDEVDGYIFDFSKRSTRLANDSIDRTVVTVGFTGRKKRWTLCPSCDCIPKADKREKIVGQWKILYLPPKGGNLIVPRCVYEAYGDVVDDCNYFAATLCPQQTYCAKHSNQTSFLNRNWHYSYRHQFALQDYIVFCDHLQSIRLVWRLQTYRDKSKSREITAEVAEQTLINVMQRILEYSRVKGFNSSIALPITNNSSSNGSHTETEVSESVNSSTPTSNEKESIGVYDVPPISCNSSDSLNTGFDFNIQLQLAAAQLSSQSYQPLIVQQTSLPTSYGAIISRISPQNSVSLQDLLASYLDERAKSINNGLTAEKDRITGLYTSLTPSATSINMSDGLSNCSSTGTTPMSMDSTDSPTSAHIRLINATKSCKENNSSMYDQDSSNNKCGDSGDTTAFVHSNSNSNIINSNFAPDIFSALNAPILLSNASNNLNSFGTVLNSSQFAQYPLTQVIPTDTSNGSAYLVFGANSSFCPILLPLSNHGPFNSSGHIFSNANGGSVSVNNGNLPFVSPGIHFAKIPQPPTSEIANNNSTKSIPVPTESNINPINVNILRNEAKKTYIQGDLSSHSGNLPPDIDQATSKTINHTPTSRLSAINSIDAGTSQ
ncbi:uncharacterized protein CMU_040880 [Cryptosporidium muris RN66]|uniref:Uncharacterized protein n=1 Tax=Cryptosporidium muris (strain RN66) TaxID=441375 RepID=B6A9X7_CRYMR|nr:uncharacterized protein CMU_040880 [Cryptosporidium muris RN66]EEA05018.1 hypothetical protein, conserved [Cryptosporidium muris RN66]|eukprot:XP_002139367.1 hypothetical protein [Cryptosporidium muris RN66]